MGRTFVAASSQYLEVQTTPVTADPFTMACWFKLPVVVGTDYVLMSVSKASDNSHVFIMEAYDSALYGSERGSGLGEAVQTGTVTNTWMHAAVVFTSTTSRTVYLNGSAGAPETTSATATGVNRVSIGRWGGLSIPIYTDGTLAEVAIWNVGLSPEQLAAQAAGASPMATSNVPVRYWRLKDSGDLTDLIVGEVITSTGTTWTSDHPTVADPPAAVPRATLSDMALVAMGGRV